MKEFKRRNILPLPKVHKRNVLNGRYPCLFKNEHIEDNQIFKVKGATLQAIYTPGHTDDHVSFILLEDNSILTGDCVLGCGTSVFDDLRQYVDSLNNLRSVIIKQNIKSIYPGHGPVIRDTALEKVTDYINHRQLREDQIVSIMKKEAKWFSSYELVDKVYFKDNLSFFVKFSAQYNISHVLQKLKEEGKLDYKTPGLFKMK